jgi:hypothetical protein
MHRSGISALAGSMAKLGAALPWDLVPANPHNTHGHFESLALVSFHDQFLAAAGSAWDDWRALDLSAWTDLRARAALDLFHASFCDEPVVIVKDPRICRFVPVWVTLLEQAQRMPRVILVVRSPLEVANSLRRRDKLPLGYGILLWIRHMLDAERDTRALPRAVVEWSDFLADWRGGATRIARTVGLEWPQGPGDAGQEVDAFLNPGLRHFTVSRAELEESEEVHPWAVRIYDALVALARDEGAAAAMDALDQVRGLFDEATDFVRPAHEYQRNLFETEALAEQDRLRVALSQSRASARQARADHARLAAELEALRKEAGLLRARLRRSQ